MKRGLRLGAAAVFLLAVPSWAVQTPEGAATESALSWLALVDQGKYVESWDAASRLFQGALTRDRWKSTLAGTRGPLGKLVSRKVKSAEYQTSLPGAPDGKYVVVQFSTSFENKKESVETVTPMQEADGTWKVSGYFIR